MATQLLKKNAYDEVMSIFRTMAYAGVPMNVRPFRMQEIIKEWNLSNLEVDMLRREVLYEINYSII